MSSDSSFSEDITVIDMNYYSLPHDVSTPARTGRCSALLSNLQNEETYVKLPISPCPVISADNLNQSSMSSFLSSTVTDNNLTCIDRFIDPLNCMHYLPSNPDLNLSEISYPIEQTKSSIIPLIELDNDTIRKLIDGMDILHKKYDDLYDKHLDLQSEFSAYRTESEHKLSTIQTQFSEYRSKNEQYKKKEDQYSRLNNLILEHLANVPRNVHGTEFSKYVAGELNKLFPNLKMTHGDIDASHILPTLEVYKIVIMLILQLL